MRLFRPDELTVIEAALRETVKVEARGAGLSRVTFDVKSRTWRRQTITFPRGMLLQPSEPAVQNMVITTTGTVNLGPYGTAEADLPAACANMRWRAPEKSDTLVIDLQPAGRLLTRLIDSTQFSGCSSRLKQFAIWIITDNPPADSFVAIQNPSSVINAFRGGLSGHDQQWAKSVREAAAAQGPPTHDELVEIKQLFEDIGLPTDYCALANLF